MKSSFLLINYLISVAVCAGKPSSLGSSASIPLRVLAPRSAGTAKTQEFSGESTPKRIRDTSTRSKSAPPERPQKLKTATVDTNIAGKGRIMAVEEKHRGRAQLHKPMDIHTIGGKVVSGTRASSNGVAFDAAGHVKMNASGASKVTSKVSTRYGSRGSIKASSPGQATVHVQLNGDAHAEVTMENQDPIGGYARIESCVWGRGSCFSSAHHTRKRTTRDMEAVH